MNGAAGLKSMAYIAFAFMAIMKAMNVAKERKKPDPVLQKDLRISGQILKILQERDGVILQVSQDGKQTWLMTEEQGLAPGDRISCEAKKKYSAFESKQHQMAFETIFLVQNVTVAHEESGADVGDG